MESAVNQIASHVLSAGTGLAIATFLAKSCWSGDEAVSEAYRQRVRERIQGSVPTSPSEWPHAVQSALDRFLGVDALRLRFIVRSILLAVFLTLACFATYLAVSPAFLESLWTDAYQRNAVFRQLTAQTVTVSVLATWLCLAYSGLLATQMEHRPGAGMMLYFLAKDLAVKTMVVLTGLSVVYLAFGETRGSFGGNPLAALAAVPATFAGGLRFRNLSAVYIYTAYASSIWIWSYALAWLVAPAMRLVSGILRWDQFPVRSLGILAAVIVLFGYYLSYGLIQIFG